MILRNLRAVAMMALSAPCLDALVEAVQVSRISNGNQGTLYQCGADQFVAPFGNSVVMIGVIRITHPWDNPAIGRKFIRIGKVVH